MKLVRRDWDSRASRGVANIIRDFGSGDLVDKEAPREPMQCIINVHSTEEHAAAQPGLDAGLVSINSDKESGGT